MGQAKVQEQIASSRQTAKHHQIKAYRIQLRSLGKPSWDRHARVSDWEMIQSELSTCRMSFRIPNPTQVFLYRGVNSGNLISNHLPSGCFQGCNVCNSLHCLLFFQSVTEPGASLLQDKADLEATWNKTYLLVLSQPSVSIHSLWQFTNLYDKQEISATPTFQLPLPRTSLPLQMLIQLNTESSKAPSTFALFFKLEMLPTWCLIKSVVCNGVTALSMWS